MLIDDDGVGKVNGFNLVRLIPDHGHTGMTTTSSHTGTTRYLSYELISEDYEDPKPTTAGDIWALACIGMEVSRLSRWIELIPNNGDLSSSTQSLRMPISPTQ